MSIINCYLGVIMLWQVHRFLANQATTSQCSYDILAIFYLHCISEKIVTNWWCSYIPTCCGYTVINSYLGVIMMWQVHECHIAESDFPQFSDVALFLNPSPHFKALNQFQKHHLPSCELVWRAIKTTRNSFGLYCEYPNVSTHNHSVYLIWLTTACCYDFKRL